MHIEIHAKRFGETKEERDRPIFNDHPAIIPIEEGAVLEITVENEIVNVKINGKDEKAPLMLGQWNYTAFAICYDPPEEE